MSETVCVVGLGLMGVPIARRLTACGFAVTGWNRSPLPAERREGIALVGDLADAAASDVVILVLADSAATGQLLDQLVPQLRAGSLVIDAGSSDPEDSRGRAAAVARRGAGWVDAPVSGGPGGAAKGALAIMAGGSEADVMRARPILDALGANVAHVGGPGQGHAMKVVNQVVVGLGIQAVAEALALAAAMGFAVGEVQGALRGGSADNPQLRAVGNRIGRREYTPVAKIRTIRKDLAMAGALAAAHGLELPQLEGALEVLERIVGLGSGDEDCAVVYELLAGDGRLRAVAREPGGRPRDARQDPRRC